MAANTIANLLTGGLFQGISQLINTIRGKSPEDAEKLAELAAKYQDDVLAADAATRQAQADVNKVEAANPKVFIAGWRPFIGWVCGTGLATQFIVGPFVTWIASLSGRPVAFPALDMGTLLTLLMAMLGFGGMRTYEKISGVTDTHIKD